MLVLPQTVSIKWHNKTKKRYEDRGYLYTGNGKNFEVDVLDLLPLSNIPVKVICDYCKREIIKKYSEYTISRTLGKDCCKECRSIKGSVNKTKYAYEDVKREFEKRGFTLLETEYIGYSSHHRYICTKGHECKITFKSLLKKAGCKRCASLETAKKRRMSIDQIKLIFEKENCELLSANLTTNSQKLDYICRCGNKSKITIYHFLAGQRCWECRAEKLREANLKYDINYIKTLFTENNCSLLEDEFISSEIPMSYICSCGRTSKIRLHPFINGMRCLGCHLDRNKGENHPNWNHSLSQEERENGRNIDGYTEWRQNVYLRDKYTCQCCGDNKGGNLNAHHLDGYDWCTEKRTDVNNGVTLCNECHREFHGLFGYGGNTKEQYIEWCVPHSIEEVN